MAIGEMQQIISASHVILHVQHVLALLCNNVTLAVRFRFKTII